MKHHFETNKSLLAPGRISKLFLTGCMLACMATGWALGSLTSKAHSPSGNRQAAKTDSTVLFSIPVKGESLPTVMLDEVSVTASQP